MSTDFDFTLVFTISIGSIPARQKVTARLTVSALSLLNTFSEEQTVCNGSFR